MLVLPSLLSPAGVAALFVPCISCRVAINLLSCNYLPGSGLFCYRLEGCGRLCAALGCAGTSHPSRATFQLQEVAGEEDFRALLINLSQISSLL